jgi:hypothetical protein
MKIVQATGQTCNQFWIYSIFIAEAIEKKEKFAIWIPDTSFKYFPYLLDCDYIIYPLFSKKFSKIIGYDRYLFYLKRIFLNNFCLHLARFIFNNITNIKFEICGTKYNIQNPNRTKHLNQLKNLFLPESRFITEINDLFNIHKNKFDYIVGIHIRHGDYKTFKNGRYFYDLYDYNIFLIEISKLFNNKKIIFFITSSDNINYDYFSEHKYFRNNDGFLVNDLYGLSKCDFICGPPSTFSAWASLMGDVNLYFIKNIKDPISIKSFFKIKNTWL